MSLLFDLLPDYAPDDGAENYERDNTQADAEYMPDYAGDAG
jgi:hypothetical protein